MSTSIGMNAAYEFVKAIQAASLTPPESIVQDGKIHRFASNGRRGDDSGWYVFHGDGIPAGAFGDWRSDLSRTWRADIGRDLTPAEEAAHQAKVDAAYRARGAGEARRKADAAQKACAIWEAATQARDDHPYLAGKHVEAHGLRLYRGPLVVAGMPCDGSLIVPACDGSRTIHTLQFIHPEKRDGDNKRFLPGGDYRGRYFSIGTMEGAETPCIAEGYATAATIHEATGYPVAVAFNAGNLGPVAQSLRARFPNLRLILCADDDTETKGNPGRTKAKEAAAADGGRLVVPEFGKDRPDWATDLNDMAKLQGPEAVAECIRRQVESGAGEGAPEEDETGPGNGAGPGDETGSSSSGSGSAEDAPGSDSQDKDGGGGEDATVEAEATVRRLAALSPIEYDRARQAEADALGVRVATLDAEVSKMRPAVTGGVDGQGAVPLFAEAEPWLHPVNGAELLEDLATAFLRYVFMPLQASTILALWVIHTFCYDLRRCTPILGLTSPQKRCGKTTLMSLLLSVVNRPLAASNISPSCVFRAIDLWHPTLLIDEADSFLRDNEELRGILNSGHTRDLAYVLRTSGEEHEPRQFSTWAPKALALIGKLPPTLHDRAIVVELARKTPGERVERLADFDGTELRRRCLRWAKDYAEAVRAADPGIPAGTHDRAADNWAPLLAIADAAGGSWPAQARQALAAQPGEPDDSVAVMLLADIRQFFEDKGADRAFTADLVVCLTGLEERPWSDWRRGKPLTANQLARLLAPFKIKPDTLRSGSDRAKGYRLEDFADAFARYLPHSAPKGGDPIRDTVTMAVERHRSDSPSVTSEKPVTDRDPLEPAPQLGCHGVTDRKRGSKEERETGTI